MSESYINEKVSIITPLYNCEKYIEQTIQSVQDQTYTDWEMIAIDDASSDCTCEIVSNIAERDNRIKLIKLKCNAGAGIARTKALDYVTGRFVAYLDSDDLWHKDKLHKQTYFMKKNKCGFSCTSYEVITSDGIPLNKVVNMLEEVDYKGFLTNNLLQTVGIMVDISVVDKKYLRMPDIRRRQDAATWLQVLKAGYHCYGIKEVLGQYRRADNSLSSNKVRAVKGMWYLYRKIEKLSLSFSCYCFVRYAILAIWKRIYFINK